MKKITRVRVNQFLERYRTEERILDVGSGGSSYGVYFPNRFTIDIDPARKPDVVGDIHELSCRDGEFNTILCTEVLEHAIDPRRATQELMRVLAPGGTLLLTTRFVYPIHDAPHDYWRFTEFILRDLFSEWEIIELTPETQVFSALAVLLQRIEFQTKLRANKVSKLIIRAFAWILSKCDGLIVAEYGDIGRSHQIHHLMPTGYYLAVRKPKRS